VTKPIANLGYGDPYLMFPCGDFQYVYDDGVFDLYERYREFFTISPESDLAEFLGSINYLNANLGNAMSQQVRHRLSVEIMINCRQYYLVDVRYAECLSKIIWL
jgi:hypothetical protein